MVVTVRKILPLILPLLFFLGCSRSQWALKESLFDDQRMTVQIEQWIPAEGSETPRYDHPAHVDPAFLEGCFAQVRYRSFRLIQREPIRPAVSPAMVKSLVIALSQGLRKAGPDARVRFRVRSQETRVKLLTTQSITRGVIFVGPSDTLNLAFDMVGVAPDLDDESDPLEFDWGDPTDHLEWNPSLVLEGKVRFHETNGKEDSQWLLFPLPDGATPRP